MLLLLLVASCDKPTALPRREPLTVFATIFPLAELAREVGGEDVRVDWLVELGKPLHDFDMTRRERDRMTSTDFTLCDSYRRFETWASADLSSRQNTGRVLTCDSLAINSIEPAEGLLYLDPIVARQMAPVLSDSFGRAYPEHRAAFKQRADDFVARLDGVVAKYPNRAFGDGKVMALSSTLQPLLARFGIEWVMVDRDVYRLSDADLAAVKKAAAQNGISTVLLPYDLPPGAVTRIEQASGCKAYLIDATGYVGFKQHDTYLGMLQYNLEQLRAATARTGLEGITP